MREATTKGLMIAVAISLVTLVTVLSRQLLRPDGLSRVEYAGKIIDKSLTVRETRLGSKTVGRLRVEGEGGERFEVAPGSDI